MILMLGLVAVSRANTEEAFTLDVDDDGIATALTDGLLILRHQFGFDGLSLTSGAVSSSAKRYRAEGVSSYLAENASRLDIDGSGKVTALTDGLLTLRYLFGFAGDSLTEGAIGDGASFVQPAEITTRLRNLAPPPPRLTLNLNLHESLPDEWINQFHEIIDVLDTTIPALATDYLSEVDIYAWNSDAGKPFASVIGDEGGAFVGGGWDSVRGDYRYMVLEIPAAEFSWAHIHRYSVIAHEYFHIYQTSLSENFFGSLFSIKWLIEGGATSFESLYVQQYYNHNYFRDDLSGNVDETVASEPELYENYESWAIDGNYSSSVFMVLVLVKELQNLGHTEEAAFRLVLRDFWTANPSESNWQQTFESVFGMSVSDYYQALSTYEVSYEEVMPSSTLEIQEIFSG